MHAAFIYPCCVFYAKIKAKDLHPWKQQVNLEFVINLQSMSFNSETNVIMFKAVYQGIFNSNFYLDWNQVRWLVCRETVNWGMIQILVLFSSLQ